MKVQLDIPWRVCNFKHITRDMTQLAVPLFIKGFTNFCQNKLAAAVFYMKMHRKIRASHISLSKKFLIAGNRLEM